MNTKRIGSLMFLAGIAAFVASLIVLTQIPAESVSYAAGTLCLGLLGGGLSLFGPALVIIAWQEGEKTEPPLFVSSRSVTADDLVAQRRAALDREFTEPTTGEG